jgi:ubiquinone/menaquinone biosynthesis C-methylase UbiE
MPYPAKKHAWTAAHVAQGYDQRRFDSPAGRRKHALDERRVLAALAPIAPASVLDLPSGTGRLLPALARHVPRVVAADLSHPMLQAGAPSAPDAPRVQADAESLPFTDDSFDAVVCLRFLFHVDDPAARATILRELARVARAAVLLQVRWPHTAKHLGRSLRHKLRFTSRLDPAPPRPEVERELQAAGLTLQHAQPMSFLFSDKALLLARPFT